MTIEVAATINELNSAYPAAPDFLYEGDDHLRLLKAVIKGTFPNVTGVVTPTHTALNQAGGPGRWILQSTVAIVSAAAAVDFVNGSGGVAIDSSFDAHLLEMVNLRPSAAAELRLQASADAGTTWTLIGGSFFAQALTISATTVAGAVVTATDVLKLTGGKNVSTTSGRQLGGQVMLLQVAGAAGGNHAWASVQHGEAASEEWCKTHAKGVNWASPMNGLRLSWSTGTFNAAATGSVRLYSRKVS